MVHLIFTIAFSWSTVFGAPTPIKSDNVAPINTKSYNNTQSKQVLTKQQKSQKIYHYDGGTKGWSAGGA